MHAIAQETDSLSRTTGASTSRVFRPKGSIPPTIPPYLDSIASCKAGRWIVGLVMPRAEKSLAWWMLDNEIDYYLPLCKKRDARRRELDVPLLDGYIFFAGTDHTVSVVKSNISCYGILTAVNQRQIVADLTKLQMAVSADPWLNSSHKLVKGSRCRVVKGPLQGTTGEIIETLNGARLRIEVATLGQWVDLEIDREWVEAM